MPCWSEVSTVFPHGNFDVIKFQQTLQLAGFSGRAMHESRWPLELARHPKTHAINSYQFWLLSYEISQTKTKIRKTLAQTPWEALDWHFLAVTKDMLISFVLHVGIKFQRGHPWQTVPWVIWETLSWHGVPSQRWWYVSKAVWGNFRPKPITASMHQSHYSWWEISESRFALQIIASPWRGLAHIDCKFSTVTSGVCLGWSYKGGSAALY